MNATHFCDGCGAWVGKGGLPNERFTRFGRIWVLAQCARVGIVWEPGHDVSRGIVLNAFTNAPIWAEWKPTLRNAKEHVRGVVRFGP